VQIPSLIENWVEKILGKPGKIQIIPTVRTLYMDYRCWDIHLVAEKIKTTLHGGQGFYGILQPACRQAGKKNEINSV
jgi:hypothetical protein